MKDLELQKAIDARFEYNARFPERMNQQLGLKFLDCSREELFVDFAFDNDREVWLNPYGGVHGGVICTLFDKPEGRKSPVQADYVGMLVPNEFIVGYGLDYNEKYRNLPYIGILKPEVYGG